MIRLLASVGLSLAVACGGGDDLDGDGFVDRASGGVDCDDGDASVHPGAAEVCDGVDQDCDGSVDEDASDATVFFLDADADGFGGVVELAACEAPAGYVAEAGDCDDVDPSASPAGEERCDAVDNDCDGEVDEDAIDALDAYPDEDLDGFGSVDGAIRSCAVPAGYVLDPSDCDDADAARSPESEEVCDDVDNDCDGAVDFGLRVPADHASVQDALDAAWDGSRVCVAAGTWTGPVDLGTTEVVIESTAGSAETILDGGGLGPVVTIAGGQRARTGLVGLTLTGGEADEGAGLYASGSYVHLDDVVVAETRCEARECRGVGVRIADVEAPLQWTDVTLETLSCAADTLCSGTGVWAADVDLAIDGLTVTDMTSTTAGCSGTVDGAVVSIGGSGSALRVQDALVQDLVVGTVGEEGACRSRELAVRGGVVHAEDLRQVELSGLTVDGVTVALAPRTALLAQSAALTGGVLLAERVEQVVVEEAHLSGLSMAPSESDEVVTRLRLEGGLLHAWTDYGGRVDMHEVTVEDVDFEGYSVIGGLVRLSGPSGRITAFEARDLSLVSERTISGGILDTSSNSALSIDDFSVVDSTFESTSYQIEGGVLASNSDLDLSSAELSGLTILADQALRGGIANTSSASVRLEDVDVHDNVLSSERRDIRGAFLHNASTIAELQRVSVRGNRATAGTIANGWTYEQFSSSSWDQVVFAGNELSASGAARGGVAFLSPGVLRARNVSAHANTLSSASGAVQGGFIYVTNSRDNHLALTDSDVSYLILDGSTVQGGALYNQGDGTVELGWCNLHEVGDALFNVSPGEGMLDVDPGYVDTSGDPAGWDLRLTSASPLVDAGDPDRVDDDGTRVDIGAWGGEGGSGW